MDQPDDELADLLAGLRTEFLETASDRVRIIGDVGSQLGIAVDPLGTLPLLIREAHSLKGGGGTFGCPALGEAAGEVERLARHLLTGGLPLADLSPLRGAIGRLRDVLGETRR